MHSSQPRLPQRQLTVNRMLWLVIAVTIALDVFLLNALGIRLRFAHEAGLLLMMAVCFGLSLFHRYIYRDDNLALFTHVVNQLICVNFIISTLQCAGPVFHLPFTDKNLAVVDSFLGFDWHGYIGWLDKEPWLATALSLSYGLCLFVALIMLCLLFLRNRSAHGQRFIIIFYTTGIVTCIVSGFFPALGEYGFYGMDVGQFHTLHVTGARMHEATLLGLRDHSLTDITFPSIAGLVAMPSFHAVIGILLIYASLPLTYFRLLVVPMNIFMLFSLPVDGGHYLIDIVAGVMLAVIGIVIAEWILPRHSQAS